MKQTENKMLETEREWYIQVPWGKMCVIAWGNCFDPPVLLCHGAIDTAASFRPLVKLLPQKFYYIAMELPGNGKSDPFPPGLMISIYDLVYAVEAVVKHFRWESVAMIAHSMGAAIGKIYNLSVPGKLNKLVQLDPINMVAVEPDQFSLWYNRFFTEFYENYDKYNIPKERAPKLKWEKAVENIMKRRGISHDMASATLERMSEHAVDGLIRYTYDARMKIVTGSPFSAEHMKQAFTKPNTPLLDIIFKESLDNGLYRNTQFLQDEKLYICGNYRKIMVDGNHDTHITHPERFAACVAQFLQYGLEGLDSKAKL